MFHRASTTIRIEETFKLLTGASLVLAYWFAFLARVRARIDDDEPPVSARGVTIGIYALTVVFAALIMIDNKAWQKIVHDWGHPAGWVSICCRVGQSPERQRRVSERTGIYSVMPGPVGVCWLRRWLPAWAP